MLSSASKPLETNNEVIQLTLVDGKLARKPKVRYNKDGTIDKRHSNKVAGKDAEVYAFNTKEEINAMIDVLDKHIEEAYNENLRQIAYRNKMLFLIGINISLRASDLRRLKWSFFFKEQTGNNNDNDEQFIGEFRDFYVIQPMKQRKQKKFVKLFFNQAVKKAITDYIAIYPIEDMDDYLFKSRKGVEPLQTDALWDIIKKTAAEAGIEKNIGSHSLRKTFGYWAWHNAEDKNKALVTLQLIFNHSSVQTTMKYIGLLDTEIADMFYSIDLGLDYM